VPQQIPVRPMPGEPRWLFIVQIAQHLLACARQLYCPGAFLEAAPMRLRYQVLGVDGWQMRSGRSITLRLDAF
jgi:hypothetical protein